MKFPSLVSKLACGIAFASAATLVLAQDGYPNKPIKIVVPFSPGGGGDAVVRIISEKLGERLGQPVIIENRPGASGYIGAQAVATAVPDGYTILMGFDGSLVVAPNLIKAPFDTAADFAPITKLNDATLILAAHSSVGVRTLKELVELSKTTPGGLMFGSSGPATTTHLAGELLAQRAGMNLTHVPYKGGGQAMTDVLGGTIPLVYTAVAGAYGHVQSGKLRAIAVSSAQRATALPDVPTFIESGVPDFVVNSWVGLLAPAETPPAVLTRLNTELNAVLNDATVREKLRLMGIEASPGSAEQFGNEIKRDLARYGQVVKSAGIQAE